jgi:hypothetical protein
MMSFADTTSAPAQDDAANDVGHPATCQCPVCMPELYVDEASEQAKEVA